MSISVSFSNTVSNREFIFDELCYYTKKLFSLELKQVDSDGDITVDCTEEPINQPDSINVHMVEGKCAISGNHKVATLIAVYRLFHELGVRFLKPGRENEYIPQLGQEAFKQQTVDLQETASFTHRGVCIEGADSYETVVNFIDWLPKIGMNSFFIQFENPYSFFKRWYEHEFNPYLEHEPFSTDIAQEMSDKVDDEMFRRGIVHHRVGHGWTGEVLGYSSKYGWESGLKLPDEKKPLVAELNHTRELFKTAPILTSLDFANPEVSKKMVESIVAYAKERKDVNYLHVWLSDACNNICECEQCLKDLPADQYVRILNDLDKALTEEGLDTKICFLLYHELLFAPAKETIHNPSRFTLMFAPISRTFEKSYADVDYDHIPEPSPYVRNNITLPNSLEENLACLFAWKKLFNGDSFVYDYPLGRAHYGDLGYMSISHIIFRDIQYLHNLKLNGYISCQELRAGFPHMFPNYVMGQMLWNRTLDYQKLCNEYFHATYGEKADEVVAYLEELSQYSSCDYFNAIGKRVNPQLGIQYAAAEQIAESALPMIEKNTSEAAGTQKLQWLQLGYHREYAVKISRALRLQCEGKAREAQLQWRDLLDFIRRNEPQIAGGLDVYRVIEVAKNYAGLKL